MLLLANENIPLSAVVAPRTHGHDVLWIREKALGITDIDVMALGHREERVLVTFDKDFGELAFCTKQPPARGIIFFRIPMISSALHSESPCKSNRVA